MGFFTTSEVNKLASVSLDVDQLKAECGKCGRFEHCTHRKMEYSGEGRKKILIIGSNPTETDDEYGIHFAGETGDILKDDLDDIGISLFKDCWSIHAVNCYSYKSDDPSVKEVKCCLPFVEQTIYTLKPKVIILCGKDAVTSLFGDDFSKRDTNIWRAFQIPDEKYKCFIVPTFDPKDIVKFPKDKSMRIVFQRDLKKAVNTLQKSYYGRADYESYVKTLRNFDNVVALLKRILETKQTIVFDYEGTGLKPYREGHKIVSIGIALSSKEAYAFPYNHTTFWKFEELKEIERLWKLILKDKNIRKICHNIKFEDSWSAIRVGTRIANPYWCSMIAQKIIDNRASAAGLKFQTFVRYGVRPYDKHMRKYLESSDGSEFNTVEKAPLKELLVYNGLDCIFTFMLYEDQKRYLSRMNRMNDAFRFFMNGIHTMGLIQLNGVHVNEKYYSQVNVQLIEEIEAIKKSLTEGREARSFQEQFNRPINITSNDDLGKLFYEVLGKNPVYTANRNYKTDAKTLESLNLPYVDKLIEMKKLEKARGTYLAQFAREVYKGVIHPFFDLHIPVSYRSSSSNPNWQNLPKRNKRIKTLIRKGIIPSPDHILIESDFSGAEVITSVAYHKDKNFYNYLIDPSTDMHRDMATLLFLLPHDMLERKDYSPELKALVKEIRFYAKNNWTFAQFYGDWFGSCGPNLWENVVEAGLMLPNGMSVRNWLASQGIIELGEITPNGPTPDSFLEHCKYVEDKMWNERFPGYTQWKKDIVESYHKYGFIETYFGFRFQGYMDRKQCCNYPIQGTSFHLLLYTLNRVAAFIRKNKFRSKLVGQIHDSCILDVHKDEVYDVTHGIHVIVSDLTNKFKWLTVPMVMEFEVSKLRQEGGNFAEMEPKILEELKNLY